MKIALGKAKKGSIEVSFERHETPGRIFVRTLKGEGILFRVGKEDMLTARKLRILSRSIIRFALTNNLKSLAIAFDHESFKAVRKELGTTAFFALIAENMVMANYNYTRYKTKPKAGFPGVEEVLITENFSPKERLEVAKALVRGITIGTEVNACRTLSNTPGGDMTPTLLAEEAKKAVRKLPITVKVLEKKDMKELGMGSLLAVAKGSSEKPTFTVLEYKGSTDAPIVLVGKGITFDSGGLNIKSSGSIYEMHMDMSGAAACLHTIVLAARLKLKKHIVALLPSAENMLAQDAYRPGDVLTSMSGTTIEVLNTDAEGRLILADALTYSKKFKPSAVVDVATLTGAAMVALGLYANGIMSRDRKIADTLLSCAEKSGDYSWELPLWDEYEACLKDGYADLTNICTGASGRYGGAIEGGMFLWQFAKDIDAPWAHIDMAPRMTAAPGEELAKGAAGSPVRLLLHFIEEWK